MCVGEGQGEGGKGDDTIKLDNNVLQYPPIQVQCFIVVFRYPGRGPDIIGVEKIMAESAKPKGEI